MQIWGWVCRRNEILEGLMGQEETLQLLEKYPISNLNHALLSFVATARGALGPNMLKVAPSYTHHNSPHSSTDFSQGKL